MRPDRVIGWRSAGAAANAAMTLAEALGTILGRTLRTSDQAKPHPRRTAATASTSLPFVMRVCRDRAADHRQLRERTVAGIAVIRSRCMICFRPRSRSAQAMSPTVARSGRRA